jgi:hypothetical protein
MRFSFDPAYVRNQIEVQVELAALTEIGRIRAMHQDLETLYRSQLVALLTAEQFGVSADQDRCDKAATPPRGTGTKGNQTLSGAVLPHTVSLEGGQLS